MRRHDRSVVDQLLTNTIRTMLIPSHERSIPSTGPAELPAQLVAGTGTRSPQSSRTRMSRVMLQRMLVPIDLSMPSETIVPYAVTVAERFGSSIEMLGVVPKFSFLHCLCRPQQFLLQERLIEQGDQTLLRLARSGFLSRVRGGTAMRYGDLARESIAATRSITADLVVMAFSSASAAKGPLFPSATQRVVRAQPCLVLAVPENLLEPERPAAAKFACESILVPVDLTETSRLLATWASGLAEQLGARITLCFAPSLFTRSPSAKGAGRNSDQSWISQWLPQNSPPRKSPPLDTRVTKLGGPLIMRLKTGVGRELLEWVMSDLSVPVAVDFLPDTEAPDAEVVARMVERAAADLIVVGGRKCSWWQRLTENAAADRLLRAAPCPVLNVPENLWTKAASGAQ